MGLAVFPDLQLAKAELSALSAKHSGFLLSPTPTEFAATQRSLYLTTMFKSDNTIKRLIISPSVVLRR